MLYTEFNANLSLTAISYMESNLKTGPIIGVSNSEILEYEFKKFILDVSKPNRKIEDMDFADYNSEKCL